MIIKRLIPYTELAASRFDPVNFPPRADYLSNYISRLPADIGQMADEFNATAATVNNLEQSSRSSKEAAELAAQIANSSANIKGEFKPGVTNALQGETWIYEGSFWYALVNTTATPSESSGDWASLSRHGSLTNRDESGSHPASAITDSVWAFDSMLELLSSEIARKDGQVAFLRSYHQGWAVSNDKPIGCGAFIYKESIPKNEHDGGVIIDPLNSFPSNWNNQDQLESWFSSAHTGTGCWVRLYDSSEVDVCWYGMKENQDDSFILSHIFSRHNQVVSNIHFRLTEEVRPPVGARFTAHEDVAIRHNGRGFIIGRDVKLDFKTRVTCTGFSPTVFSVDGLSRPAILFSDTKRSCVNAHVYSGDLLGTALELNAVTDSELAGIISWFECDISVRNLNTACLMRLKSTSSALSYINSNILKIGVWGTPNGVIQELTSDSTGAYEMHSNYIWLDYQTSDTSEQAIKLIGNRNIVRGELWDAGSHDVGDEFVYIGGLQNDVGTQNWPSPESGLVTLLDTSGIYIGSTYGNPRVLDNRSLIAKNIYKETADGLFSRMGMNTYVLPSRVEVAGGNDIILISRTQRFFDLNSLAYSGWLMLQNTSLIDANYSLSIGMNSMIKSGKLSVSVGAGKVVTVPLSWYINKNTQCYTIGFGSETKDGYSSSDLSNTHELYLTIDTPLSGGCRLMGGVINRSEV